MKRNKLKIVFLTCLVAVLAVSFAWAGSHKQIVAQVPHDFMVGETMIPAGKYFVEREGSYPPMITCRNESGEGSSLLHVITTLARDSKSDRDPKLVFDKTNDRYELSEIWFAGEDGFLVCGTVASHTHDVVVASK
jgi:hypothetical protein